MTLTDEEIRVKVAELMGWKKNREVEIGHWTWWTPEGNLVDQTCVPRFDSDPSAALQLCDRMRDRWGIRIFCTPGSGWKVVFSYLNCFDQLEEYTCEDPSLARAVTLAFLKAHENKPEIQT